jgi:CheY-like chemotaxis protein
MNPRKASILIAEDDAPVRTTLAQVLSVLGYAIRTVNNGLQAVAALREQVPDILLCDLNMPDMSGYELLSIVNRRFPEVRAVAMSGAFLGNEVTSRFPADAYYQKGEGIPSLLESLESAQAERPNRRSSRILWMPKIESDRCRQDSIRITCPECFRTFPQVLAAAPRLILDTVCVHCGGSIVFAVVPTFDTTFAAPYEPAPQSRPN